MKKKAKKIVRKLTPSQVRAKLVSALRTLGYTLSSQCREQGHLKAWLRLPRAPRNPRAEAVRVSKAVMLTGLACQGQRETYGGEYSVDGPRYHVTVNQEPDTGNGGGAFVEVY